MTPCMPLAIKLSMLPATVYISREKNTNSYRKFSFTSAPPARQDYNKTHIKQSVFHVMNDEDLMGNRW